MIFIPDYLNTQEMCEKTIENDQYNLKFVPDHFKMQEICDKAVGDDFSYLQYVPDCFVTKEWVQMWYDYSEYCDDDDEDNFLSGAKVIKNKRLKKPQ